MCLALEDIVHPESFRSNAQNAIAFARRNRPRVNRSDRLRAFICVCLRVLFAIVCVRVRACNRTYVRAIARTCVRSHLRYVRTRTYIHVRTYIYMETRAREIKYIIIIIPHLDPCEFACVHTHKWKRSFLRAFARVCMRVIAQV